MNVNLYHNKSLANVVHKTIGTATVVTGTAFVLPFDERFPQIRFTSGTDFDDYNYAQIDGKYYYITGVNHITNQETIVSFELDLLMTYQDYIKGLTCYLKRSDNHDTPYINDEMEVVQCNQTYTVLNFPANKALSELAEDAVYILVTTQHGYGTVSTSPID